LRIYYIVSAGRSGSTLLRRMAGEQFDDVWDAGEIFNPAHTGRVELQSGTAEEWLARCVEAAERRLRRLGREASRIEECVFLFHVKTFDHHLPQSLPDLLDWLNGRGAERGFVVGRANYLRRLISLEGAKRTGVWHLESLGVGGAPRVRIDPHRVDDADVGLMTASLGEACRHYYDYFLPLMRASESRPGCVYVEYERDLEHCNGVAPPWLSSQLGQEANSSGPVAIFKQHEGPVAQLVTEPSTLLSYIEKAGFAHLWD
jgi:hypothetical protein